MKNLSPEFIRNVLPGDFIEEEGFKSLGIKDNRATVIGKLCMIKEFDYKMLFIKSKTMLYDPMIHDIVVGRVFYSTAEYYKVDLGRYTGILPPLNVSNSSKRNKLELVKNDLVLAKVIKLNNEDDKEVLLCCKTPGMGKVDKVYELETWKIRFLYFSNYINTIPGTFRICLAMNGYFYLEAEDEETEEEIVKKLQKFTGDE